ncbi:hypothetical protein ACLOJK_039212, partial [Asimina triloba]
MATRRILLGVPKPAIVRSSMQLASSSRSRAGTLAPRGRSHLQQSSGSKVADHVLIRAEFPLAQR